MFRLFAVDDHDGCSNDDVWPQIEIITDRVYNAAMEPKCCDGTQGGIGRYSHSVFDR